MRRQLLLGIAFILAAIPCELGAQQIVPFIGGGLAMGTGDLGEDTNNGWFVLGGVDVPLTTVTPGFAIGVAGSYARIPYDGQFDEATQVTTISGELSYLIGEPAHVVRPYIRAGGGVQIHRYDPGSLNTNSITDTRAGFTAGAGLNVRMSAVDVVVGARFASGSGGGFLGFHGGLALPVGTSR
jgi:opacity protein-like surface antigen